MRNLIIIVIIFLSSTLSVKAETLIYKAVLEKAVKNSYDLKSAEIDVKISQTKIKEARADYFPMISANLNSQYDRDLTGGTSSLTPVGDSIVVNSTRYVNAVYAGVQYNLFDFGVRKKKLDIAKTDKTQKQIIYSHNYRDLKLNLSDIYTRALLSSRELSTNQDLLELNKTLFSMSEQLYKSGISRKTDLTNQALKVAVLINKIDDLKTELNKALKDLSLYTGETYTTSAKLLNLFEEEEGVIPVSNKSPFKLEIKEAEVLDTNKLPEYKEYQLEIDKKKMELSILKRQNLPQFKFYTNYYIYGSDKDNYLNSFEDMGSRSLTFRVSSVLPVFDGLKNQAQRERAKLEIEKLQLQQDKKLESVKSSYEKAYLEAIDANKKLENQDNAIKLASEKMIMLEKLNNERLIDKVSYLKEKADLITQKFELEKTRINSEEAAYKLRILAEAAEPFPVPLKTPKTKKNKGVLK